MLSKEPSSAHRPRLALRFARDACVIVVGVYLGLCGYLYVRQGDYVYRPDREIAVNPKQHNLPYEDLALRTADGVSISAWFVRAGDPNAVVFLLHGNAENMAGQMDLVLSYSRMGYSVLALDYRGYGKSEGQPDEQGTYMDVDAAWEYLTKRRGIARDHIVVHGRSLGGALAAYAASQYLPAGVILESTFTSIPDRGAELFPMFPVRLLSKYQYNSLERMSEISCPVLVVHSVDDEVIAFVHGQRLYQAAREPKTLVAIHGSHTSGSMASHEVYDPAVREFLRLTLRR